MLIILATSAAVITHISLPFDSTKSSSLFMMLQLKVVSKKLDEEVG